MLRITNFSSKNIIVKWIIQKEIETIAPKYIKGKLIDVGCSEKPYQKILRQFTLNHIGLDHKIDHPSNSNIDICCTAYEIPLSGNSFDSTICNAVLEHLEEPEMAIRECYRVLKPGGHAIYTVPFIWHLHEEPRDFYRFTNHGLKYLFEKSGFEIVELKALSGFWVTFGQLFTYYLYRFDRGPLKWLGIVKFFGLLIQLISFVLDKVDKAEQWTWMYLIIARKPDKPNITPDDFTAD